jgi:hypothetical protein
MRKPWGKNYKATMVNLTKLLPGIRDRDNLTKKKSTTNNEAKSLITKWQMMIFFFKNQILIKDHFDRRQPEKKITR